MLVGVNRVAVVTPVYLNEATLAPLVARVAAALAGRSWRLRFVVDASPDGSLAVARDVAAGDRRIAVTSLPVNRGQNLALARGLTDEGDADAWVCLDADLQDPPEAIPLLLDRLTQGDAGAVFAGRRGGYESTGRLVCGKLHRVALSRMTGLPADAGAFVALGRPARDAIVRMTPPSVVAGIGVAGVPAVSIPVVRNARASGRSAWTSSARVRQSFRTLAWTWSKRQPSHRWTRTLA